jgi:ubiquinone/menaquinone biosynthesis C-methylase UbiE
VTEAKIRFSDGSAYDRMMGHWSRLVGEQFLDWLALKPGLVCIDVGCGNGAFTELLVARCAPRRVHGVDPSAQQVTFARGRHKAGVAEFQEGDAMALPFSAQSFDTALMALVIFYLSKPEKGVAEMARVTRPGGVVAAYAWDFAGGGSPTAMFQAEFRAIGIELLRPPSTDASRLDSLRALWQSAGFDAVETREITVQRSFVDFEDYWTITTAGETVAPPLAKMPGVEVDRLKARLRAKFTPDAGGRVTASARANAVKGRLPK